MLDHPLVCFRGIMMETGVQATRIAAVVWGRDDDAGGLEFKQPDIDRLVSSDVRSSAFALVSFPADPELRMSATVEITCVRVR